MLQEKELEICSMLSPCCVTLGMSLGLSGYQKGLDLLDQGFSKSGLLRTHISSSEFIKNTNPWGSPGMNWLQISGEGSRNLHFTKYPT